MPAHQKVLVTGGEGFVGFHLVRALLEKGSEVASLDLNLAGRSDRRHPGVRYVTGSTEAIQALFAGGRFDMVYHLGEYSRVENSFQNIEQAARSNLKGTVEVFEFWRKLGCKLLYAGSSTKFASYGEGEVPSPYAWMKAHNTELVERYAQWFGLPYATTYFYNAYGPHENEGGDYGTLIGIWKRRMREGLPLAVVKPGTQKRNFTHIRDIVSGLVRVGEAGSGGDHGIGSDEAYSVLEIAELFGGKVDFLPERRGNRLSAELRTDKTKALGWAPQEHIRDYIEGLKKSGFVD